MRIRTEREKCVSSGQCVMSVPDVFDQDEDEGMVVVLDDEPPAALHDDVRHAEEACPVRAIVLDEGSSPGGE
ncbi:ferredoxin [Salininema proteolyticum]|uniref:Ferredoxin n=1 Tax=Salininema proteolyticum TaxID=1607685 RepID=A0ABV8TVT5_9ACTN